MDPLSNKFSSKGKSSENASKSNNFQTVKSGNQSNNNDVDSEIYHSLEDDFGEEAEIRKA